MRIKPDTRTISYSILQCLTASAREAGAQYTFLNDPVCRNMIRRNRQMMQVRVKENQVRVLSDPVTVSGEGSIDSEPLHACV